VCACVRAICAFCCVHVCAFCVSVSVSARARARTCACVQGKAQDHHRHSFCLLSQLQVVLD